MQIKSKEVASLLLHAQKDLGRILSSSERESHCVRRIVQDDALDFTNRSDWWIACDHHVTGPGNANTRGDRTQCAQRWSNTWRDESRSRETVSRHLHEVAWAAIVVVVVVRGLMCWNCERSWRWSWVDDANTSVVSEHFEHALVARICASSVAEIALARPAGSVCHFDGCAMTEKAVGNLA